MEWSGEKNDNKERVKMAMGEGEGGDISINKKQQAARGAMVEKNK